MRLYPISKGWPSALIVCKSNPSPDGIRSEEHFCRKGYILTAIRRGRNRNHVQSQNLDANELFVSRQTQEVINEYFTNFSPYETPRRRMIRPHMLRWISPVSVTSPYLFTENIKWGEFENGGEMFSISLILISSTILDTIDKLVMERLIVNCASYRPKT